MLIMNLAALLASAGVQDFPAIHLALISEDWDLFTYQWSSDVLFTNSTGIAGRSSGR